MPRKVDPAELVSVVEIAARLELKRRQLVYDWRRRYPDFPEPIAKVGNVSVWVWSDVREWCQRTGHPKR